ncbi:MAG: hypothetical protein AVDCRST_MAG35-2476, partial [uncultured Quadrisphaera sp.]
GPSRRGRGPRAGGGCAPSSTPESRRRARRRWPGPRG